MPAACLSLISVEKLSAIAQSITGLLAKLMMLGIIGFGALAVFSNEMTIGALVAFNMLAGRVSGPLLQMVTMVHEYQEVALAVQMLGEVMNKKPEREGRRNGLRPNLSGKIEFENVSFRYGADGPPALDDISFTIPAGSMFGIVGRSGSGKTTLTRLIAGLYPIQDGLLRVDGFDAREGQPDRRLDAHHTEPTRAAREEPDSKDWLRACLLIVLTIVEWRPTD